MLLEKTKSPPIKKKAIFPIILIVDEIDDNFSPALSQSIPALMLASTVLLNRFFVNFDRALIHMSLDADKNSFNSSVTLSVVLKKNLFFFFKEMEYRLFIK